MIGLLCIFTRLLSALHLHLVGVALILAFDTFTSGDDFGDKKRSAKNGQHRLGKDDTVRFISTQTES